jgi:5-methylcytosine-specific restriction endonuclease McrA
MARATEGFYCKGACHTKGVPCSYEVHHVWPQEFHGPSTPDNMVKICCNCHSNTHDLLNKMLRNKPFDFASYSPTERRLAVSGYNQVMAYSMALAATIEEKL